ncbi:hypothetical protein LCGC14_2363750, partial [marine sediment metagenome]
MTQPTKPSAGAMRASKRVKKLYVDAFTESYMAEVIDRETGMVELLGAAG